MAKKKLPSGWRRDAPEWTRESGQAWVYRVRRANDERRYALKRWRNPTRLDRFAREINAMIALRQAGLTAIPEVLERDLGTNPWPYLITPWYADGSLADRIAAGIRGDVLTRLGLCQVLAEALHGVHQHGYAHRDLKPENILFDGEALRLGDFGLCLEVDDEQRLTSTSEAVGSRYFIAPENEGGMNEANDQRPADFYAFGKLLWCILTGRRPLPREQQLQSGYRLVDILEREEVTPLDALGEQLLDTDPRSRLAVWRTVLAELGEVHATLTGTRSRRPPPRSVGGEALVQARRVAALPVVQQAAADHARARKVREWIALLRRDLAVEANQRFAAALQEVVDASGHELQISVGGSGGHDPVELLSLQPALSVPGLEIDQAQAQDGMFAAVQLLAFGSRTQFPMFRVGLYLLELPRDLWLLPIPSLQTGARSSVLQIPEWLLEGLPEPRGPLPYLMEHTRKAAIEMAEAVGDWFLDRLLSYLRIIAEGLDIANPTSWTRPPRNAS